MLENHGTKRLGFMWFDFQKNDIFSCALAINKKKMCTFAADIHF